MNSEQVLNAVETAVAERNPSAADKWFLCWKGDVIQCQPIETTPRPEVIFFTLNLNLVEKGFTAQQWSDIRIRIARFLLQKGLL